MVSLFMCLCVYERYILKKPFSCLVKRSLLVRELVMSITMAACLEALRSPVVGADDAVLKCQSIKPVY